MSSHTLPLTPDLRSYLLSVGVREHDIAVRLREETVAMAEGNMQICAEQGALMGMLVSLMGARRILEVGTFTGYSALVMALALPSDGRITCCDRSATWTAIAERYWAEAGVADRIALHLGPAAETLAGLIADGAGGAYDLAFIDADKEGYAGYLEACLTLVRPGGAILFDNVLWGGSAADPSDDRESTRAIRTLNAALVKDERVEIVMVPVGDGLTICRVR